MLIEIQIWKAVLNLTNPKVRFFAVEKTWLTCVVCSGFWELADKQLGRFRLNLPGKYDRRRKA
jgi:hypothetical protein